MDRLPVQATAPPGNGNGNGNGGPQVLRFATSSDSDGRGQRTALADSHQLSLFQYTNVTETRWALEAYRTVPAVYAGVSQVAKDIATLPYKILSGPKEDDPGLDEGPLIDLLEHPNPAWGFMDLMLSWVTYLEACGAGYLIMETLRPETGGQYQKQLESGTVKELWTLRPDYVTPEVTRRDTILGYRYGPGVGEDKIIPAAAIAPVVYFDPKNPVGGRMPPILSARVPIASWINLTDWNNSYFENGTAIGLVVTFPEQMSDQEFQRFKHEVRTQWTTAKNAHKVLVLSGFDGKIETIPIAHKEMGFQELAKMCRREIWTTQNIPQSMAGDYEEAQLAQVEMMERTYWRNKIRPLTKWIESSINRCIVPRVQDGVYFRFDLSDVDALQEDKNAALDRKIKRLRHGLVTPNELLDDEGASDLQYEDGDKHYIEGLLSVVGEQKPAFPGFGIEQPEPAAPAQEGGDGEDGVMAPPPPGGEPAEQVEQLSRSIRDRDAAERIEHQRAIAWRGFATRLKAAETQIRHVWDSILGDLAAHVVNEVRTRPPRIPARGRAFGDQDVNDIFIQLPDPAETYLPDYNELLRQITDKHSKLYKRIVAQFGEAAIAQITKQLVFDAGSPSVLTMVHRDTERIGQEVTILLDDLRETLEAGLNEGETMRDLVHRIRATVGASPNTPARGGPTVRSERIARTEGLAAANTGTYEAFGQAGVKYHTWLSSRDDHVRDSHRKMEEMSTLNPVPVGQPFPNGCLFPGDPSGPASEIINCRCSTLAVVE